MENAKRKGVVNVVLSRQDRSHPESAVIGRSARTRILAAKRSTRTSKGGLAMLVISEIAKCNIQRSIQALDETIL